MQRYDEWGNPIETVTGEIVTPEMRIRELEAENDALRGGGKYELVKLFENPGQLQKMFNLNETQAVNVASLLTGASSAASRKYLTKLIGAELAGAVGGFVGGYISKKLVGR